jgi:hypothetical protein
MPEFIAWRRPSMATLTTAVESGRLRAELPLRLHDDGGVVNASTTFLLAGPGDATAISSAQIVGRRPLPGTRDAEATMMAHVELAASDLPWRYSPVPYVAGAVGVRPWLVLVVGAPGEVELLGDGRVRLTGATLFAEHPLAASHRWAHAHDVGGRQFARVVSPRTLATGQDYVAVLVPAWTVTVAADGSAALADSWPSPAGTVVLRCFDHWTFRTTTEPGDFAFIAQRLDPLTPVEAAELRARRFGRAAVGVAPFGPEPLRAGGALTTVPEPGDPPLLDDLPAPVADAVEALAGDLARGDRWVLTLPRYDVPWHPGPVDGEPWQWPPPGDEVVPDGWRRELRVDPRHRGAAGIGAWAAIEWQDRISDGAARQAAAVAAAAQRIRHLTLGLDASRRLWKRRVPTEPLARLAALSPLLGRLPTDRGGTALDAVAGRTPALARGLFSSAARRMLRRRGPLARSAAPGATALGGLIAAANACPPLPPVPDDDAAAIDVLADRGATEALAESARGQVFDVVLAVTGDERAARSAAGAIDAPDRAVDLIDGLRDPLPVERCVPIPDLHAVATSIAAGIDPTVDRPIVVDRVLGPITGLRPPELAEPDIAPELDIPLWKFLSERAPDWLLPGAGDVPDDRVLAVQTNPTFIDAVLVGANHQTLGELRWRNLPITTRWTPLRRFWERVATAGGEPRPDIRPIVRLSDGSEQWTDASPLGDVGHLADPRHRSSLVVVLHTELFRRYPATIVYLTPNAGGAATWGPVPAVDEPAPPLHREYPAFSGTLTPELVFFGFDVPPSAGSDHWLVLEEPPPGFRFRHPQATDPDTPPTAADLARRATAVAAPDGATFAEATFAPPARVFFGNLL